VALHRAGLIENVADLYDLTLGGLVNVPLFSRKAKDPVGNDIVVPGKLAENVLAALETSKRQPFARVLFALGMRHVGSVTAEALARHLESIDGLQAATAEELASVPGIGPVVAEAVRQYLGDARNAETIAKLRAHGLRFAEEAAEEAPEGPLAGQTYVLTGRLESLTRGEAQARIEALGGKVGSSVTRATSAVVAGEDPGSKLRRAEAAGLTVLDESAFLALLEDADAERV
jgi:DNA ligase (NAD+)